MGLDLEKNVFGLYLDNGLDQVFVDGHKLGTFFVINQDIRQADEQPWFFVNGIGHAVSHGRDEKITHVCAIDRPNPDSNLFAF